MIKTIIEINLNNVSKEEVNQLKSYLENKCWNWKAYSYQIQDGIFDNEFNLKERKINSKIKTLQGV
jgi:hypothetical protein